MNRIVIFALLLFSTSIDAQQEAIIDTFHGIAVIDQYRWLENINSDETQHWLEQQEKQTSNLLREIEKEQKVYRKINRYAYTQYSLPYRDGDNYYRLMYDRYGAPPSIYTQRSIVDKKPFRLVNPLDISNKDRIEIANFKESENSKYLAFSFSRNGSDWREIMVKKLSGGYQKDHLMDVKFSPIAWKGDGFFYLKYPKNGRFSAEQNPMLMYHLLGTEQEEDEVIFRTSARTIQYISFSVTPNKDFLIIRMHNDQRNTRNFYIKDLRQEDSKIKPLLINFDSDLHILTSAGDTFIALTNFTDQNNSVVQFNINQPKKWFPLIPAYDDAILTDAQFVNDQIVCEYLVNTKPIIVFYSKEGEQLKMLEFEKGLRVNLHKANPKSNEMLISYSSYFIPPIVKRISLEDYSEKLVQRTEVTFSVDDYKLKTLEYKNRDGVSIPITIVHKKDIALDGNNPTILKTYGGFGWIHTPSFDPGLIYFMNEGGIFAYCQVRGEGSLGVDWEHSGKHLNKKNAINDFIDGAKYLIANDYTNSEKLAITGSSHGGMVVGAAMTQEPELFKIALPDVGVFDMIRAENFTVGAFHKDEFGTISNKTNFEYLLSYSPYHNIKKGVNYPISLILTAENDDRVPPFHSYKFAAALQNNKGQANPVYLKVEKKAGHGGASNLEGRLKELADLYGFVLHFLK